MLQRWVLIPLRPRMILRQLVMVLKATMAMPVLFGADAIAFNIIESTAIGHGTAASEYPLLHWDPEQRPLKLQVLVSVY